MNDSNIFNDLIMDGGGVDPSINESIRESIQCSFVSSECNGDQLNNLVDANMISNEDKLRDFYVMNRMNWMTYLKVLFD